MSESIYLEDYERMLINNLTDAINSLTENVIKLSELKIRIYNEKNNSRLF